MTAPDEAPQPRPCNLDGHRPRGRKPITRVWDKHHQARVWADVAFAGPMAAARMHGVSLRTVYNIRDYVDADPDMLALGEAKLEAVRADLDARSHEVFGAALGATLDKLARPREFKLQDAVAAVESLAKVFGRHKGLAAPGAGTGGPVLVVQAAVADQRPDVPRNDEPPPPPDEE